MQQAARARLVFGRFTEAYGCKLRIVRPRLLKCQEKCFQAAMQEMTAGRSEVQRAAGARLVFGRIIEAYGRKLRM